MKFTLPDLEDKSENYNARIDTFWENFNASRCKTAMLVISLIIVFSFSICEVIGSQSIPLYVMTSAVFGFWTGRHSKNKDKHISFEEYQYLKSKNEN